MCNRSYYRCADCLTVAAADGPPVYRSNCGLCGGRVEYMGRVQAGIKSDRLVVDRLQCPCDLRCTNARGPNCDCHCGGENHGTGLLVPFVRDVGPVPVLKATDNGRAVTIAAEWRNGLAVLDAELDQLQAAWNYSGGDRRRYWKLKAARERVIENRTHKARMKTLREFLPELAAVCVVQATLF